MILTQDADDVSTSTLTRAIILPEFSDVGVRNNPILEPTKLWGPNLYDRWYEPHEPLERKRKGSDSLISILRVNHEREKRNGT
jgi:hypothetical protein